MWTALLGRWFLSDPLHWSTIWAIVFSMIGVAVIFIPEVLWGDDGAEKDSTVQGDLVSFVNGIAMASYITLVRHASQV